ncbi:hypothetical protein ACGC1H_002403 [Rhizoctonia solani]|uniref:F-box domain-containing protein n=1 Tax=Rhizoctonia solani TaxID=456999 RepID=A0A8H3B490_9AGAM|nr:unnamed protein product [Rhizoctonia solani]
MSTQLALPKFSAIREWELAGLSLSNALDKYLVLCEHLGTNALRENTHPQQLATRIESSLESFHTALGRQLSLVHSALARTRNQLASLIYSLPREILTEVFMNVVYFPLDRGKNSMGETALHMFHNLYSLQRVCGSWRDVILSQGSFWQFALIYCQEIPELLSTQAANLALKRSKGDLYLAAVMDIVPSSVFCSLPLSPRFRKINFSSKFYSMVNDFLKQLLEFGPPFNLLELSLHESGNYPASAADVITILSKHSANWDSFCALLKSLSVFRVRGAHFDWDHMAFSSHLVELHIQDVMMGSDTTEFAEFLRKLSLASNLRNFKLISVQSFSDLGSLAIVPTEDRIHFPRLESLLLEDLSYNTLNTTISYISPGSHRLTLYLTDQCITLVGHVQQMTLDLDNLLINLRTVPVHTLVLSGDWEWEQEWLADEMHSLLDSLPQLQSLKVSRWSLSRLDCDSIAQPQITGSDRELFPQLEHLDLSDVRIYDEDSLKRIVTSHPIKRMALGGSIQRDTNEFDPIQGNEPIVDWLRLNVPEFTLRTTYDQPPEYFSSVWQLW